MYKYLLRPLLFMLSPERIHKFTFLALNLVFRIPFLQRFTYRYLRVASDQAKTTISGLVFKNKVGLAAGMDKNASCVQELSSFGFSHIEIGTVTPEAQPGNPKPRLFRLKKDQALINRMGINNAGLQTMLPRLKNLSKRNFLIGANIGKNTKTPNEKAIEDYLTCFNDLYDWVDYFTINVSCPNVEGLTQLQDPDFLLPILSRLATARNNKQVSKPIFLKISPDLSFEQLDEIVDHVIRIGIDGIVATNTTHQRENLVTSPQKIKQIGNGGLSGIPLKERSNEIIRHIHKRTQGKLPIIGVGGIMSPADAVEKLRCGAWLIQVYTGFIYSGPLVVRSINKAIHRYLNSPGQ